MVCNCTLSGTESCKNCMNHTAATEYQYSTTFYHTVPTKEEASMMLKIISDLNKHIGDLKVDNKKLKEELRCLKESKSI